MSDLLPSGRRLRIAVALVVVAVIAAGGFVALRNRAGLPDGVVLRVDGHGVALPALRARSSVLRALYGVDLPTGKAEQDRFWRDVAQSMAMGLVIEDSARERGVTVTDAEARLAEQQYVASIFGEGADGRQSFLAALGSAGASEDAVVTELSRQLLTSRLLADVTRSVPTPSDEDLRTEYARRSCNLGTPEKRRISNIVVVDDKVAGRVVKALRGGTPFARVAADFSADASSRQKGGRLGLVGRADLDASYAKVAFAAPRDALFGPVRTSHGWNVGQVTEIQPAKPASFEDSRAAVAQLITTQARSARWRSWLRGALVKAKVVYADRYRPSDPGALPAGLETAGPSAVPVCEPS